MPSDPTDPRALEDLLAETRRRGRRRLARLRLLGGAAALALATVVVVPASLNLGGGHGQGLHVGGRTGSRTIPTTVSGSTPIELAPDGLRVPDTYQQACARDGGGVCPPGTTGSIPAALKRPLHFPVVQPGQQCPATAGNPANNSYFVGVALGSGTVRVLISNRGDLLHGIGELGTGGIDKFGNTQPGWFAFQTLWFSMPGYDGPFVVRARRLDGPGPIAVSGTPTVLSPLVVPPGLTANSGGYRTVPGSTWVKTPGCYGWQVDGLTFSEVIIVDAVLPAGSATTSPLRSSSPTTTAPAQTLTISPAGVLADGQVVHLVATGFTPGEVNVGIAECLNKGSLTMQGDCDLAGIKAVIPDASGTVTADFVARKGPFGANRIVCSNAQQCVIAVTQLVYNPTQVAGTNITFAP